MGPVPPFRAVPPVSAHWPETGASVGRSHTDERAPTTFPLSHRESVTLSENTTTAFEAGQHILRETGISKLVLRSLAISVS